MLTALDRLSIARLILEAAFGRSRIDRYAGPLFWTADPDGALAQIILTLSPEERANHAEELNLLARALKASNFLDTDLNPTAWAQETHTRKGLMPVEVLASGIGEGFGLLRHSFEVPVTDLDVMAVHDAISDRDTVSQNAETLRQRWREALPGENATRAWALVSLLYYPHIGAQNVLALIDAKRFTLAGLDRLTRSGFLDTGLPLTEVWAILRGEP
jgi:hypothetical protein